MELELGLSLPNINRKIRCKKYIDRNPCRFDDEEEVESKDSSSSLVSNGQHDRESRMINCINEIENDEDEDVIGWPPMSSWRKDGGGAAEARNSMFVKVKMAGVPIGRKIDLRRFASYQALTHSLINMFAKYTNNNELVRDGDYTILYQDNEGDWLLAGDVPWEIFVESVHRMEIQRKAK